MEELGALQEEVVVVLIGKRSIQVREIRTSCLLTSIRVVCSVVQHTVLPQSGNKNVMTKVDQMIMFCLITRRRINLVRLILDFIFAAVHAKRRRHHPK